MIKTGHGVTEVRMKSVIAVAHKPTSRTIFQNPVNTNRGITIAQTIRNQRGDATVRKESSPTPHPDLYVIEAKADADGARRNTKATIRFRGHPPYEFSVNTSMQRRVLIVANMSALREVERDR